MFFAMLKYFCEEIEIKVKLISLKSYNDYMRDTKHLTRVKII
jgi:hypothetical protein